MKSNTIIKKFICLLILTAFSASLSQAGVNVSKSDGVTLTGADGVTLTGMDGADYRGLDGFLSYAPNGVTLTGADGVTLTGADGVTLTGADGATYTGTNGVTLTGADGVTLTGADGVTLTGADGVTLTGADGRSYTANSIFIVRPNGVTLTGADGVTLTGVDGFRQTAQDGVTLTGADGVTLTGADGVTLTGADSITGVSTNGIVFSLIQPTGVTLTGVDGVTLTGADGVTLTGADGVTLTGVDSNGENGDQNGDGLQGIDPELANLINESSDDSNINAILVYHKYPDQTDLTDLREAGIGSGTIYKKLPMIQISATRKQIAAISKLKQIRSIWGNRTLKLNADSYFNNSGVQRVLYDNDLRNENNGMPISGKNVTVAVLDTGVNSLHNDLAGKVVQNVKLADSQSAAIGFVYPNLIENTANTDLMSGHGTFVSGIIAATGVLSGGKYAGVSKGANILGLSAGDLNLSYVLAGFDYILERGANYNVRVVNCSFSSNTVFDFNDPVNVATKMLTQNSVNVVFSAGNSGSGNNTLNPYAAAPWVVSVGAVDQNNKLADFSSRGSFGSRYQKPSLVASGVNVVSLRSAVSQTGILGIAGGEANRLAPAELPFYTTASGTSFSAPQVAGAIALMLEANPKLTTAQVKDILQRTATPLPNYYQHEIGAGVLNTHAAVRQAAFPNNKTGVYRAVLERKQVSFDTRVRYKFIETVNPGGWVTNDFVTENDVLQVGVHIAWGGMSDLNLKLKDSSGNLLAHSNYLNAPGLTGKRERVTLNYPEPQAYRVYVEHTGGIGASQKFYGAVQLTKAVYFGVSDLQNLTFEEREIAKESLRSYLILPQAGKFNSDYPVLRHELAAAFVRSGLVPQYISKTPSFADVSTLDFRNSVESVQFNPSGKLFFDAGQNGEFRPYQFADRLIAAVALVKAAKLENLVSTAMMPMGTADLPEIPSQYRGYVAVALGKGLLKLDGKKFNSHRHLTRLELANALVQLKHLNK